MRSFLAVCAVLSLSGQAVNSQSTATPSTLPHPNAPGLYSIELNARIGARRPGDRPRTMSESDRKRLAALRKPSPEDVAEYDDFLKQDSTGLVRVFPDADCVQKNVVRVDGECANYVTGASGVSFRKNSDLYDIRMSGGQLIGDGFFSMELLTDLGPADLNAIDRSSDAISALNSFKPGTTIVQVKAQIKQLAVTTSSGAGSFAGRIGVEIGHSYAIRVIAFKPGNVEIQKFGRDRHGVKDWTIREEFQTLKYDDRSDVIAVFRVVRRSDDGSITIVWKRLSRQAAPKLMFADDEPLADLK